MGLLKYIIDDNVLYLSMCELDDMESVGYMVYYNANNMDSIAEEYYNRANSDLIFEDNEIETYMNLLASSEPDVETGMSLRYLQETQINSDLLGTWGLLDDATVSTDDPQYSYFMTFTEDGYVTNDEEKLQYVCLSDHVFVMEKIDEDGNESRFYSYYIIKDDTLYINTYFAHIDLGLEGLKSIDRCTFYEYFMKFTRENSVISEE